MLGGRRCRLIGRRLRCRFGNNWFGCRGIVRRRLAVASRVSLGLCLGLVLIAEIDRYGGGSKRQLGALFEIRLLALGLFLRGSESGCRRRRRGSGLVYSVPYAVGAAEDGH